MQDGFSNESGVLGDRYVSICDVEIGRNPYSVVFSRSRGLDAVVVLGSSLSCRVTLDACMPSVMCRGP